MNLRQTQALFWSWATGEASPSSSEAEQLLAKTEEFAATERMEIYAGMYRLRQADALREDFPKLHQLLGEERFGDLALAYLPAHPSAHPSLSRFGAAFAGFVSQWPGLRADAGALAELEWARAELVEAPDAEVAGVEQLASADPETLPEAVWKLVPAHRFLRLSWEVSPLWQALEGGEAPPPPRAAEEAVMVWRKGFEIFHVRLRESEAKAVERALAGGNVSDLCECFSGEATPEIAALKALASWFSEGWIQKQGG